jgi:hypothetical protein
MTEVSGTNGVQRPEHLGDPRNDAARVIAFEQPYVATATVEGTSAFLFRRWSVEGVAAKAKAAKGSKAKKEDDVASYVWRLPSGELGMPGEYFRGTLVNAARYRQDPRSPRKSAMELFKAGVVALTELCGLGTSDWDYLDRRRVQVQRNAITRVRPAMLAGWHCTVQLQILLPEYIEPQALHETLALAGRIVGVGDFRPTFGRFQITQWSVASA